VGRLLSWKRRGEREKKVDWEESGVKGGDPGSKRARKGKMGGTVTKKSREGRGRLPGCDHHERGQGLNDHKSCRFGDRGKGEKCKISPASDVEDLHKEFPRSEWMFVQKNHPPTQRRDDITKRGEQKIRIRARRKFKTREGTKSVFKEGGRFIEDYGVMGVLRTEGSRGGKCKIYDKEKVKEGQAWVPFLVEKEGGKGLWVVRGKRARSPWYGQSR